MDEFELANEMRKLNYYNYIRTILKNKHIPFAESAHSIFDIITVNPTL